MTDAGKFFITVSVSQIMIWQFITKDNGQTIQKVCTVDVEQAEEESDEPRERVLACLDSDATNLVVFLESLEHIKHYAIDVNNENEDERAIL